MKTTKAKNVLLQAKESVNLGNNELFLLSDKNPTETPFVGKWEDNKITVPLDYQLRLLCDDISKFHFINKEKTTYSVGAISEEIANKVYALDASGKFITFYSLHNISWPSSSSSSVLLTNLQDTPVSIDYKEAIIGELTMQHDLDNVKIVSLSIEIQDLEGKDLHYFMRQQRNAYFYLEKIELDFPTLLDWNNITITISPETNYIYISTKNEEVVSLEYLMNVMNSYITALSSVKMGELFQLKGNPIATTKNGAKIEIYKNWKQHNGNRGPARMNNVSVETLRNIMDLFVANPNIEIAIKRIQSSSQAEYDLLSSYAVYEAAYRVGLYPVNEDEIKKFDKDREQGYSRTQANIYSVLESIGRSKTVFKRAAKPNRRRYAILLEEHFLRDIVRTADSLRNRVAHHNLASSTDLTWDFIYHGYFLKYLFYLWVLVEARATEEEIESFLDYLPSTIFRQSCNYLILKHEAKKIA